MTLSEIGLLLALFAIHGWAAGIAAVIGCRALLALVPESVPRLRQAIASAALAAVPAAALVLVSGAAGTAAPAFRFVVPRPADAMPPAADGFAASPLPIAGAIAAIWIGVALVLLVREAAAHAILFRRRRSWRAIPRDLRERHPSLQAGAFVTGPEGVPMTVGAVRPVTFLPLPLLQRGSPETIESIARHELAHAMWLDPLASALARLVRIAFWPILPLLWLDRIAANEMEAAADRAALPPHAGFSARAEYAETLLELARRARWAPPAAVALTKGALERRIRRIVGHSRRSPASMLLAAVLLAGSAGAAATLPQFTIEIAEPDAPVRPTTFVGWIQSIEHPVAAVRRRDDDEVRVVVAPARIQTVVRIVVRRE